LRSLADWLSYQQRAHPRAVDLSLERVCAVAARLGLLQRRAPLATIGGTNGKGSTAMTLACLLQSCGQRVGLFTSPHLLRYNERIRIDGAAASDSDLVSAFEHIEAARGELTLTFFEYNALAALELFQRAQVDAMVLEVGLGGRLDATNILSADVAVVCSIGFDHRDWLGDTLDQIGAEKAGIFRAGQKVVLGTPDMPPSVWQAASALNCEVWTAGREFSWTLQPSADAASAWDYHSALCELPALPAPSLAGSIQYQNAASALTALQLLNAPHRCERDRVISGLEQVSLPGRFQIVPGEIEWILDVAHNEPAAEVLARSLRERRAARSTWAVFGTLSDKDSAAIALQLDAEIDHWVLTGIGDDPRGLSATTLRERLPPLRGKVELADDVLSACQRARAQARAGERVVVLGSFHVVGPALAWLGLY
jgi:dihydrofolate synthase / folylpolyglutamate synthase